VDLNGAAVYQVRQYNIFFGIRKEKMDYEIEQLLREAETPPNSQP